MARTGTGTRRPGAKTTGSGAKATVETTDKSAAGAADQADSPEAPQNDLPESETPESKTPESEASAATPAPPAADVSAGAAPEGDAPSAGEAPEQVAADRGTESAETPAGSTGAEAATRTVTDPVTEPPIASMTGPAAPVAPPPPPPARRGSVVPLVLGGVVAAAIGAGAVLALLPQGWQPTDITVVEARLAALETRDSPDATLAPLEERIAALENASPAQLPDLQPLEDRLSVLEANDGSARLEQRIEQLEGDLTARMEAGIDRALEGARDRQDQRAQAVEAAEQELADARARLEARTALAELAAATETGQPAPAALPPLAAVIDLPPALNAFAEGLPQLSALQTSFAGAARDALAAAPLDEGSGTGDRVLNFLRSQTGARSLAPRAGDDTDAILSRAEAHVRAANLSAALTELDALPEGPAAAMAGWRAQAETRLNALAALAEVQSHLNNQ